MTIRKTLAAPVVALLAAVALFLGMGVVNAPDAHAAGTITVYNQRDSIGSIGMANRTTGDRYQLPTGTQVSGTNGGWNSPMYIQLGRGYCISERWTGSSPRTVIYNGSDPKYPSGVYVKLWGQVAGGTGTSFLRLYRCN